MGTSTPDDQSTILTALRQLLDPENPPISAEEIDQRQAALGHAIEASDDTWDDKLYTAIGDILELRPRMLLLFPALRNHYAPRVLDAVLHVLDSPAILKGKPRAPRPWMPELQPWISGQIDGTDAYGWDDEMQARTRRSVLDLLAVWAPKLTSSELSRVLKTIKHLQSIGIDDKTLESLTRAHEILTRSASSAPKGQQDASKRLDAESDLIEVLGYEVAIPLVGESYELDRSEKEDLFRVLAEAKATAADSTLGEAVKAQRLGRIADEKTQLDNARQVQRSELSRRMRARVIEAAGGKDGMLTDRQIAEMRAASELVKEQGVRTAELSKLKAHQDDRERDLTSVHLPSFNELCRSAIDAASRKITDLRTQSKEGSSALYDESIHLTLLGIIQRLRVFVLRHAGTEQETQVITKVIGVTELLVEAQIKVSEFGLRIVNVGTGSSEGKKALHDRMQAASQASELVQQLRKVAGPRHWWSRFLSST